MIFALKYSLFSVNRDTPAFSLMFSQHIKIYIFFSFSYFQLFWKHILDMFIVTEFRWFLKNKSDSLCIWWRHLIYLHYTSSYFVLSICPNFSMITFLSVSFYFGLIIFFLILLYPIAFRSSVYYDTILSVYPKIVCIINLPKSQVNQHFYPFPEHYPRPY